MTLPMQEEYHSQHLDESLMHAKRVSTISIASTNADEKSSTSSRLKAILLSPFDGGSVIGATFTLIAATIGTGIVMISDSLAPSGTIWSSVQMVFCVWLSWFTLVTLVRCANDLDAVTYQELAMKTYGSWFRHLVNFCIFFANWGSAILYFQLSNELLATVCLSFGGSSLPDWLTAPDSKIMTLLQATLFVFPLSAARELKALRYFCFVNFLLILFIAYCIIYEGFNYDPLSRGFRAMTMVILNGFATTFPSAVFMMTPHPNVIDVFRELKHSTMQNIKTVITWTVIFSLIIYLSVGLIGYATFAPDINILSGSNYANSLILVAYGWTLEGSYVGYTVMLLVCMIGMAVSSIISQPFNLKPAKDSLRDSVKFMLKKYGYLPPEADENDETTLERFLYTFVTMYTCVVVVLYFDGAQMVVNIVGSSFTTMFCFIFPSVFYVKIHKHELTLKDKIIHGLVIVICSILAVWTTVDNIIDII